MKRLPLVFQLGLAALVGLVIVMNVVNFSDGVDGLVVVAGDVPPLVDAIEHLFDDPEKRLELGLAARRRVENTHSWDDYGASVLRTVADRLGPSSDLQRVDSRTSEARRGLRADTRAPG